MRRRATAGPSYFRSIEIGSTVLLALTMLSVSALGACTPSTSASYASARHIAAESAGQSVIPRHSPARLGPEPQATTLNGVDVYHGQGTVTWSSVHSAGYDFAFAKATQGITYIDPDFTTNMANGNAAGMYMAGYDFACPVTNSADVCTADKAGAEADYFDNESAAYFKSGYMYPALDLEVGCGTISVTALSDWVDTWMTTVESYISTHDGYSIVPMLYIDSSYAATSCLDSSVTAYHLWVADWGVSSPNTGQFSTWSYWQYSDTGSVPGISGGVDMDYFNGNLSQLQGGYTFQGSATLSSVAVTPASPTVNASSGTLFTATPTCSATCPSGITYAWALTSTTLGTISPASGTTTTFTAGSTAGTVGLYVNATLSGITKKASTIITVSATSVTLNSVTMSPTSPSVYASSSTPFTVTPSCSSTCPGTITYAWALTSISLGTISPASGATTTFIAGSTAGTVGLYVNASLGGTTKGASTIITITTAPVTLNSVSVAPKSPSVPSGSKDTFTATPSCSSTCPGNVTYAWVLTSTKLGSISPASSITTTFTAGTTAGTVGLYVNATLGTTTVSTSTIITVTVTVVTLKSVSVTPATPSIPASSAVEFTATPTCSTTCPTSGISYAWTVTSSGLGSLSGSGASVNFTAGTAAMTGGIFVNATLNSITQGTYTVITVTTSTTNSLTSVSVTPASPSVASGGTQAFMATPECSSTCPAPDITYAWVLTSAKLGSINPDSGTTTTFTAGYTAGNVGLYVNATLNGTTQVTSAVITVTTSSSPVLTAVSLTPLQVNLSTGGSQLFEAVTTCTGGTCPSTITYVWSLNNSLGSLSSSDSASTTFTAGPTAGQVTVTVSASLNGKTVHSFAPIVISSTKNAGTGGLFSGWFLWLLIAIGVVVVVVIIAVAVSRKKGANDLAQPPPDWPTPCE